MLNKNVCPNCGQIYDTDLSKCPLCGTAPQVVDTADPVQRKRITEAERRQRRADRKQAEQEAKQRRKDARFMQDADEERLLEEEEARRKEEKRRMKEEKQAARRAEQDAQSGEPLSEEDVPAFTPAPARDRRAPMPAQPTIRDRRRVPRVFLALSALVLLASLVVGGSYLLWKLDKVKLPIFDELAAKKDGQSDADPANSETNRPENAVSCTELTLSQTEITFENADDQTQLIATLSPEDTTDERMFSTSDPAVARVSPVGIVTAVGPGEAVITVTCGDCRAQCVVHCSFEAVGNTGTSAVLPDMLLLNKVDMTFAAAGENYVLSIVNLPAGTSVEWKSMDESVCTVDEGGHVYAVGAGTTRVLATVGELSAECWVRCRFE